MSEFYKIMLALLGCVSEFRKRREREREREISSLMREIYEDSRRGFYMECKLNYDCALWVHLRIFKVDSAIFHTQKLDCELNSWNRKGFFQILIQSQRFFFFQKYTLHAISAHSKFQTNTKYLLSFFTITRKIGKIRIMCT